MMIPKPSKPKLYGELRKRPVVRRRTTRRVRRSVRINKMELKWLKEEAHALYPLKKSYKALYVETALKEFLVRETLVSADFENPDDFDAIELTKDLFVFMGGENLGDSEVFFVERSLHENLVGYEIKIRRFLEMHPEWLSSTVHINRVSAAVFRYALSAKINKDRTLKRFKELEFKI